VQSAPTERTLMTVRVSVLVVIQDGVPPKMTVPPALPVHTATMAAPVVLIAAEEPSPMSQSLLGALAVLEATSPRKKG
jgi:hypothetical protein